MKIAVVGGGIFGTTAAWMLARAGHTVHLFEKESDIMRAASGINQYRLHRGYHYPRSLETGIQSIQGEVSFREEYREAIVDNGIEHYYCIAKEKSLSTATDCLKTWSELKLPFEEVRLDVMYNEKLETSFRVEEYLFDPLRLRKLAWGKLREHKVEVLLNTVATEEKLASYDQVILATYAQNNSLLSSLPDAQQEYQFELCEKIVLRLPEQFKNKSIVVIDGPFMCIDPYSSMGLFVMGNVEHAIHKRTIGKTPVIPSEFLPLLNRGILRNPPITNIKLFMESASEFFSNLASAEHVGSMYTVRTVPTQREFDDARPTTVRRVSDSRIVVFSGKIGTCVDAAKRILELIA